MKIAIVTDSTAYLDEKTKQNPNLFIVPIPVIIDGKVYNEGVDIEEKDFYPLLKNSREFPTTSQPAIGEVLATYQEIAAKGYDTILSIHLSSGISGFIQTLYTIKDEIAGVTIYPYDSLITSMPMGHMVKTALQMAANGDSLDAVIEKLDDIKEHTSVYLIVDDLNNLVRGGRLTNGAALIGSLLKIKPILTFEKGKIVLFEKIRSTKKAFARAEEMLHKHQAALDRPMVINVVHANNLAVAQQEKERLTQQFPDSLIEIGHFGPVIGAHLGEKAIGIIFSVQ